jgi:hypothetical protein
MPPPITQNAGGPGGPWTQTFNVTCIGPTNPASQKVQFAFELLSTDSMCLHGGTFWVNHIVNTPRGTVRRKLFSVVLPKQPSTPDIAMRNYEFIGIVTVDLTLGKNFELDWLARDANGLVLKQDSFLYPPENVHA